MSTLAAATVAARRFSRPFTFNPQLETPEMRDLQQPSVSGAKLYALLSLIASAAWSGSHVALADGPATAPTTAPTASADVKPLLDDLRLANQQLNTLLPPGTLGDPAKRQAAAGGAVPVLRRMESDFDGMIAAEPAAKRRLAAGQLQALAMLATLGDKPSVDALASMAASGDPRQAAQGQGGRLLARWYAADGDAAAQQPVIADLDRLLHANPADNGLALQTLQMSRSAGSPQLRDRLQTLAGGGTSSAALAIKAQLDAAKARAAERSATLGKLLDKPMTVAGTRSDGKPFSTADWKGKVVLVDFWATWCGPCKVELPRVKALYKQYHPQGLEMVAVSNDYDVEKLKAFVASQDMPWPELFDADAAADRQWSQTTLAFGIDSIPVMFLIDKKGIARSVTARENTEALVVKLLAESN